MKFKIWRSWRFHKTSSLTKMVRLLAKQKCLYNITALTISRGLSWGKSALSTWSTDSNNYQATL